MAAPPPLRYTNPNPKTLLPESFKPSLSIPIRIPNPIRSELNGGAGGGIHITTTTSSSSSQALIAAASSISSVASMMTAGTKKNVCLFFYEEMRELAERIAMESDAIELRSIIWRLFITSFSLVLPFYPTGTSERMEDEGNVATAYTLAKSLSDIPISKGGPTSIVIFDIHALQERFYFGESVLPLFESGIPLLLNRLQQLPDSDNISIAFPDDGSWKRFNNQLQHFPMIICTKVREGNQRIVRLKEGDPRGRHVVIVDDLVQSGVTLIECQKVLTAQGAAKVSAYVTHGVFPNRSWERFQSEDEAGPGNGWSYFWITDSCPRTVKEVKNRRPFEILSLASSIADALQI